jgi:hypothetical protein
VLGVAVVRRCRIAAALAVVIALPGASLAAARASEPPLPASPRAVSTPPAAATPAPTATPPPREPCAPPEEGTDPAATAPTPAPRLVLDLEGAGARPRQPRLVELQAPAGRVAPSVEERLIAAEQERARWGGDPNGPGGGVLRFSVSEIARRFVAARRAARTRAALPPGVAPASLRSLEVAVIDRGGSAPPEVVSALAMVKGFVMDAVTGACTPAGRCVLEGFPPAADAVLLRAHGAALVRVAEGDRSVQARMGPAATLVLHGAAGIRLRVRTADGLAVPIHPAANPARRDWLATPGAVPLVLPAGRYTVEVSRPAGPAETHTVDLAPEQTVVFRVPGVPAGSGP